MIEKLFISDQCIIDCLNSYYGIKVETLSFLALGADIDASVYKAQTYDKSSYFIKVKRGHALNIGVSLQTLLYNGGIQHIIAPIRGHKGQTTHNIDDFTLIVYPFIEGQDGFSVELTSNQWVTLGKALRKVHEFNLPALLKDKITRESYSSKWRNAVRSIYTRIDTESLVTDEIGTKLLTFMQNRKDIIQRLVDHAEYLAEKSQKQSPEFVLCHSDIHAGNVLIANDGTLYIVDWDHPIMAPKERDLMFIGGGVGNVWSNPHEEELFYEGYGKTDINRDILAYYRHERIVEDIAIYSQQLLVTTDGGNDRAQMYKQFTDMFEQSGVVEIAFKTNY